jgi:DNA-binding MarR family transcriptional regulator
VRKSSIDPSTAARAIAGECVATRVQMLGRAVTRLYDDALRPHGVTAAQLAMLVTIVTSDPPVHAAGLSAKLDVEKSSLSRNLRRMEERGWIRSSGRARVTSLEATPRGLSLLSACYPAWRAAQSRVTGVAGAASTTLAELHAKLRGGARAPIVGAGPRARARAR